MNYNDERKKQKLNKTKKNNNRKVTTNNMNKITIETDTQIILFLITDTYQTTCNITYH